MIKAYALYWKNCVNFKDRGRRSHYWWPVIIQNIILSAMVILQVTFNEVSQLSRITGVGKMIMAVYLLWSLASILPAISVTVRRLHDTGRSGWWYFIQLVPCIGTIVMLVFMCIEGTQGPNKYGEDPKAGQA